MQDLEVVNPAMLVKGIPDDDVTDSDKPTDYRKKVRWSYNIRNGFKFDLTCTQQSKRSIQDTEYALKKYEVELEIDFHQLNHTERRSMNFEPLLEEFVTAISKLLYTE
jgi:hypothetical protein